MDAHDGWDSLWMTLTTGFWLVALVIVVYIAVKLALRDHGWRAPGE